MKRFRDFISRLQLVILIIGIVLLALSDVSGFMPFLIWTGVVVVFFGVIDYLLAAFDKDEKN